MDFNALHQNHENIEYTVILITAAYSHTGVIHYGWAHFTLSIPNFHLVGNHFNSFFISFHQPYRRLFTAVFEEENTGITCN
jgi:hypothetical protein